MQQSSPNTIIGDPNLTMPFEWFAVYTLSCHEKRVAQHLVTREIEYFLPVSESLHRWKNGCVMLLEKPLFPGYLFVRLLRNERVRVLELPGVHSIVGNGREPLPLPSAEIEILRQGLSMVKAEACSFLKVGEQARVKRGPLQGMTGIVLRKKNALRLVLSLDLIMKSVSVEVDAQDLESVGSSTIGASSIGGAPPQRSVLSAVDSGFC